MSETRLKGLVFSVVGRRWSVIEPVTLHLLHAASYTDLSPLTLRRSAWYTKVPG